MSERYNINFRVVKEEPKKQQENILLETSIDKPLQELLQSVCVNFGNKSTYITKQIYVGGEGETRYYEFNRPLVKTILLGELGDYKDLLFNEKLLHKKSFIIPIGSIYTMEQIIRAMKSNIKTLIERISQLELDISVSFIGQNGTGIPNDSNDEDDEDE